MSVHHQEAFPFMKVATLFTLIKRDLPHGHSKQDQGIASFLVSAWIDISLSPLRHIWDRLDVHDREETEKELETVYQGVDRGEFTAYNMPSFASPRLTTISRIICTYDTENPFPVLIRKVVDLLRTRGVPVEQGGRATSWFDQFEFREDLRRGWKNTRLEFKKEALDKWIGLMRVIVEAPPAQRTVQMLPALNDDFYFPWAQHSGHHSSSAAHPTMHSLAHDRHYEASLGRAQLSHRQAKIYGRW